MTVTEQDWMTSANPEEMLRGITEDVRKLRLFSVACCRHIWDRLLDERSRLAIEVMERHIDGYASDTQLQEARAAAAAAFQGQRQRVFASLLGPDLASRAIADARGLYGLVDLQVARDANDAADADPGTLAASAVWTASAPEGESREAGYSPIDTAIGTANQAAVTGGSLNKEESIQADILRDIFGNPFRPVSFDREKVSATVLDLAQGIYNRRDFSLMPSLGDALEASGCMLQNIVSHCREHGVHVRGCWVLDLLLCKK